MLIGDVARHSGVSARMLRHYDSLGLVRPTGRTGGGYREYSEEDIRRIFHIESLRSLGLSLREVGRALDDPGFAPSELVDGLIRQTRERIAAETELLTRLRRIGSAEPAGWQDVLQIVALLQALGSTSPGTRQRAALSSADEAPVPVEALVEAVLSETDPNVAGALRWALARSGEGDCRSSLGGSARRWPRCGIVPSRPSPRSRAARRPPCCGRPSRTPTSRSAGTRPWSWGRVVLPTRSLRSST